MTEKSPAALAEAIATHIVENDQFSLSLGITLTSAAPGACVLEMDATSNMVNAFGSVQGGVTYGLADTAFAVASNSHGALAVGIETSMSYPGAVKEGDHLRASARELSRQTKLATYEVIILNQHEETVGIFKGTVYRTGKPYPLK